MRPQFATRTRSSAVRYDGGRLRRLAQLVAAVAVALPSLVCAQQSQQPPAASTAVATDGDVAARVGDRVITVTDVDAAWRQADPASHAQAAQTIYDGRRQALDRLVADILIADAARAKGVSAEQLTKDEIGRRTKPVTEAEVGAFYALMFNWANIERYPFRKRALAVARFLGQAIPETTRRRK